jgi:hypothetical protein
MPAFAFQNISFTLFSRTFDKYSSWAENPLKKWHTLRQNNGDYLPVSNV